MGVRVTMCAVIVIVIVIGVIMIVRTVVACRRGGIGIGMQHRPDRRPGCVRVVVMP